MRKRTFAAGAPTYKPLGEITALPRPLARFWRQGEEEKREGKEGRVGNGEWLG